MQRTTRVVFVVVAVLATALVTTAGPAPAGAEVPPEACTTDAVAEVTTGGDIGPSLADDALARVVVGGAAGPEVLEAVTGTRTPVPGLGFADRVLAISPDGDEVVAASTQDLGGENPEGNADLWRIVLSTGVATLLSDGIALHTARPVIAAGGAIAFQDSNDVVVVGPDDAVLRTVVVQHPSSLRLSDDGSQLIWIESWIFLGIPLVVPHLVDVASGTSRTIPEIGFGDGLFGFSAADGSTVIVGTEDDLDGQNPGGDHAVFELGSATGDATLLTVMPPEWSISSSLLSTPDGSHVVGEVGGDGFTIDTATDVLTDLGQLPGRPLALAADGSELLVEDQLRRPFGPDGHDLTQAALAMVPTDAVTPAERVFHAIEPGVPSLSADESIGVFDASDDLDGSNGDGTSEVWAYDVQADAVEAITEDPTAHSFDPSPSAEAALVAFSSTGDLDGDHLDGNADGSQEVFLADRDEDAIVQLTASERDSGTPALSADGSAVAFTSDADLTGGNPDLSVEVFHLDLVEDELVQVTDVEADDAVADTPTGLVLSPDGDHLAFRSWRDEVAGPPGPAGGHATWSVGDTAVVQAGPTMGFAWPVIDADGALVADPPAAFRSLVIDRELDSGTSTAGAVQLVTCPTFTDVLLDHPFSEDVEWLVAEGIASGYEDGTFRPGATVTRQAMAAFLYRLAGADEPAPTTAPFDDVSTTHPFATEITWASGEGITTGYSDSTFRPGAVVTRQAAVAFLHRFVDPTFVPPGSASFTDVSTSHPFFLEVEWAAEEGITTGYGDDTFRPGAVVTRQAAAAFLHRTAPLLD